MESGADAQAISGGRVWTARSLSALQAALAAAEPKDMISLDPALHIDLDAVGTLVIPAGVTLCGGRNEDNDGAVLTAQLADGDKWPLLVSGNSVANNSCGVPPGIETRAMRCADIIARTAAGKLVIYEGNCDGGYKRQNLEIGHGWVALYWATSN